MLEVVPIICLCWPGVKGQLQNGKSWLNMVDHVQTCRFVTFKVIYSMFSYNMSADSSAGAIQGKVFAYVFNVLSAFACVYVMEPVLSGVECHSICQGTFVG